MDQPTILISLVAAFVHLSSSRSIALTLVHVFCTVLVLRLRKALWSLPMKTTKISSNYCPILSGKLIFSRLSRSGAQSWKNFSFYLTFYILNIPSRRFEFVDILSSVLDIYLLKFASWSGFVMSSTQAFKLRCTKHRISLKASSII